MKLMTLNLVLGGSQEEITAALKQIAPAKGYPVKCGIRCGKLRIEGLATLKRTPKKLLFDVGLLLFPRS